MKTWKCVALIGAIVLGGVALPDIYAEEGQGRENAGTWLMVTLTRDVKLEQAGWGAIEHHRNANFTVLVDEKLKGTGSVKKGDTLNVRLFLHKSLISPAVSNGKKGDQLFLGLPASDYRGPEVQVDYRAMAVLCGLDEALKERLNKEKNLPVGWSYDNRGAVHSFWASLKDKAPNASYFDPSDIGVVCPQTGMPAYTVGKAEVRFETVTPEIDYYDFKTPPKYIAETFNKHGHVVKISVTNNTKETITVPALRRIGTRILWNNSVGMIIFGQGNRSPLNREKITEKTEAVTLDPGQSVFGLIDIYLMEDLPLTMIDVGGSSGINCVISLGNAVAKFNIDISPFHIWGAYNKQAPNSSIPLCSYMKKESCLDKEALLSQFRGDLDTKLMFAAIDAGDAEKVKTLLTDGIPVNVKSPRKSPLYYAVEKGNEKIVKILLAAGADANSRPGTVCGPPPIYLARTGEMVKLLLASGAKIDTAENICGLPIHWYARMGNLEGIKIMLAAGVDAGAVSYGETPLDYAMKAGRDECAKFLRAAGTKTNLMQTNKEKVP